MRQILTTSLAVRLFALIGLGLAVFAPGRSARGEEIVVSVASGRRFTGEVDPRTDNQRLWLRTVQGPIVLVRPIDWDRVTAAQVGDRQLSADELRAAADKLKSELPDREEAPSDRDRIPPVKIPAVEPPPAASEVRVVRSLEIDASLGHWTPGVEASGIAIEVRPIDADGRQIAVDGTLEVELIGQRFLGSGYGDGFPRLGRWTQMVRSADFGTSAPVYHLPFQAAHPEFDLELESIGLVHARLTVPGQGVFEASRAMVRIRPYSSVRDRLQQVDGSRFFPIEETDR